MRKIIASLDIGDVEIKLVVGEIVKNKLNILACINIPSRGVKKGFIINPESAIESLKEAFSKAEETIGIRPSKVIVGVPILGANYYLMEGAISLNPEEEITGNDIMSVLQASIYKKIPDGEEIVSIIPSKFRINDDEVVANPLGMKGAKLATKAVAITVPRKNVIPIIKCLEKINVKVVDIAIGPLGDFYEFKDSVNTSDVGALINIGFSKTEVSVFNKGILTSSEVIDIGSLNIDKDLSYVYKISPDDATYIKENMALADKNMATPSEAIVLDNIMGQKVKINQYDASEVVMGRLEEILNLAKKQINLLTKKEISYIIIVGGMTEISEFKYLAEQIFKNVYVGDITEIGARHNKYSTALGYIKYYDSRLRLRNRDFSIFSLEEQNELGGYRKVNINDNSILGKIFGYFFDN